VVVEFFGHHCHTGHPGKSRIEIAENKGFFDGITTARFFPSAQRAHRPRTGGFVQFLHYPSSPK